MASLKNVDEYIQSAPIEVREKLKELRAIIKTVAPNSQERISYGIPYYDYKGKLIYFSISKKHIGVYIPPPVIEEHAKELKAYKTAKATVRLPLDEKLPSALIKKLIKARVKKNSSLIHKRKDVIKI